MGYLVPTQATILDRVLRQINARVDSIRVAAVEFTFIRLCRGAHWRTLRECEREIAMSRVAQEVRKHGDGATSTFSFFSAQPRAKSDQPLSHVVAPGTAFTPHLDQDVYKSPGPAARDRRSWITSSTAIPCARLIRTLHTSRSRKRNCRRDGVTDPFCSCYWNWAAAACARFEFAWW